MPKSLKICQFSSSNIFVSLFEGLTQYQIKSPVWVDFDNCRLLSMSPRKFTHGFGGWLVLLHRRVQSRNSCPSWRRQPLQSWRQLLPDSSRLNFKLLEDKHCRLQSKQYFVVVIFEFVETCTRYSLSASDMVSFWIEKLVIIYLF